MATALRVLCALGCVVAAGCDRTSHEPAEAQSSRSAAQPTAPLAERIEKSLQAAQEYLQAHELAKAQAIVLRLIERSPAEARGYELHAHILAAQALDADDRAEAEAAQAMKVRAYEQCAKAVELDPRNPGLHNSAGVLASSAGLLEEARAHFEAAAVIDPANPQHPLFEAQMLVQQRNFKTARQRVERALALDPDEPAALATLGVIDLEQGNASEAIGHIERAREIAPSDLGLRVQQARILRRSGQPLRAVELLVALDPDARAQPAVTQELSAGYEAIGEFQKAAAAWAHHCRSASVRPSALWRAQLRAAQLFEKAGRMDEAAAWLTAAKLSAPDPRLVLEAQKAAQRAP